MKKAEERVDLNSATVDELTALPSVGPTTAKRIAQTREEERFGDWDDVLEVPGIGAGKLDDIKPHATLESLTRDDDHRVGEFDALLVREFLGEPDLVEWFGFDRSLQPTDGTFSRDDARSFLERLDGALSTTEWRRALEDRLDAAETDAERYRTACWKALCHGLLREYDAAFDALRTAAAVDDDWARHHHVYGLIHGARQSTEDARFELGLALDAEPYPEARDRIAYAADQC